MRGDQLVRQWRIIRAIEASPNGLTVAEIAKRSENTGEVLGFKIDTMLSDLFEWKSNIGKPGVRVSLCVLFIDI